MVARYDMIRREGWNFYFYYKIKPPTNFSRRLLEYILDMWNVNDLQPDYAKIQSIFSSRAGL